MSHGAQLGIARSAPIRTDRRSTHIDRQEILGSFVQVNDLIAQDAGETVEEVWPKVIGTASSSCVRPILRTSATPQPSFSEGFKSSYFEVLDQLQMRSVHYPGE